jgi:hypothetical protein
MQAILPSEEDLRNTILETKIYEQEESSQGDMVVNILHVGSRRRRCCKFKFFEDSRMVT